MRARTERRREPRLLELEDPLRVGQVRQGPEPEVAQLAPRCEGRRRGLGRDDLPTVAAVGDPVGAMDVDADVAVLAERRRAGVQADPDPHRRGPVVAAQPPLRVCGRRRGRFGGDEDCEELVSTAVDLVTGGSRDGVRA